MLEISYQIEFIEGGKTNLNLKVIHKGETFIVRLREDIPVHGIYRFNELSASRAAQAAGISPEIFHVEPRAMVLRFIEGKTLEPHQVREPEILSLLVSLLKTSHCKLPEYLLGTALTFLGIPGHTWICKDIK